MSKSGSLFLHKPKDITSFQALSGIKKELGTSKVGHAGTLDKFASGLLNRSDGENDKMRSTNNKYGQILPCCFPFRSTNRYFGSGGNYY